MRGFRTKFRFDPAMGGYNIQTHLGLPASFVGKCEGGKWMGLRPDGMAARDFTTREAAAKWCDSYRREHEAAIAKETSS